MTDKITSANFDYRSLVVKGYDNCAEEYQNARKDQAEPSLDYVFNGVSQGGFVLDAACGCGIPVCSSLSLRYRVTGVDISPRQIELARKNVPEGTFIVGDLLEQVFPRSFFNAITCFYALFHIPKEKHRQVLTSFYTWLKPSGLLLISLSRENTDAYTEDDFFGETMYWSNYGIEEYQKMLFEIGFKVLKTDKLGHGYEDVNTPEEDHPLFLAEKMK